MVQRIVSGGQTGVDRAALDAASNIGLPIGGWVPRGRRAEDGRLPDRYPLRETPARRYIQRTEWNVRDSDATLILTRGEPRGGTKRTIDFARLAGRPFLVVDLADSPEVSAIRSWTDAPEIATLNIAGPRESQSPGIYEQARRLLEDVFAGLRMEEAR